MSIWGKIIGGATGLALGGPIGALLATVTGHVADRVRGVGEAFGHARRFYGAGPLPDAREIAFTIGVIVLGAKLAKADGRVTADEVTVFKRVFDIPPEDMARVGKVFREARSTAHGFEPYARQIAQLFRGHRAVLEELLDALFAIAKADGAVHQAESDYLRRVARIFGLDERAFNRLAARHLPESVDDPYAVLGVSPDATTEAIRHRYRRLVLTLHPDKLIAQGMPKDFVDLANQRLAAINAAWDRVRAVRGKK